MPLAAHLRRYWNPALKPLYDRVAPVNSTQVYVIKPRALLSDKRSAFVVHKPLLLHPNRIKADVFTPLLVENSSELAPPRPAYAAFPTNKRKLNSVYKSKQELGRYISRRWSFATR